VRPYIYVDDVQQTLAKLTSLGGVTVKPPYPDGNLTVATRRATSSESGSSPRLDDGV
jgi:hypothetical protein